MAEDVKVEEKKEEGSEEKCVAYKLLKPLGETGKEGDIVQLPENVGDMLVKEGHAEVANPDEVYEHEEQEEEIPEPVLNSVNRLTDKIEKSAAAKIAKTIGNQKVEKAPVIPAEVKTPIYRSNGRYVIDQWRAQFLGDQTARNRCDAFQKDVWKSSKQLQAVYKTAPLGINETTQAQGGYLVNQEFSKDVFVIDHDVLDLTEICGSKVAANSNILNQRYVNETSLANSSIYGGLNLVATTEGNNFTSSLPAWNNVQYQLQKFVVFVYFTVEELQDASYPIERQIDEYCAKTVRWGVNTQVLQGSTLEGLINCPATVTVTASSNDTSFSTTPQTNLTYADVTNVWNQVYPTSKARGIWLYHPALDSAIHNMAFTFGGATPAFGLTYDAQRGLEGDGQGTIPTYRLFNRPAYPHPAMSAPGTAGDFGFFDFSTVQHYYRDLRTEWSKEFQFGSDQYALRVVWRGDVKGLWRNKVTMPTGSTQFSAYVIRGSSKT